MFLALPCPASSFERGEEVVHLRKQVVRAVVRGCRGYGGLRLRYGSGYLRGKGGLCLLSGERGNAGDAVELLRAGPGGDTPRVRGGLDSGRAREARHGRINIPLPQFV